MNELNNEIMGHDSIPEWHCFKLKIIKSRGTVCAANSKTNELRKAH